MILNETLSKLLFIIRAFLKSKSFVLIHSSFLRIIPLGGIITKTFQYSQGESWDILIGNNHGWEPWLDSGYKNKAITFSCSTNNKNVNTLIDQHHRQLFSNEYPEKEPHEVFCQKVVI